MDVSEYSNYLDYEWSIALNRFALKSVGIWPENKRTLMLDAYGAFILSSVMLICGIPCLHSLVRIWGDLMLMVDNLQYTLPTLIAILKGFMMWRKKEKLVPILNMYKADWLKSKTVEQRNVMVRRAGVVRNLTLCGCVMVILMVLILLVLPPLGIAVRYVTNVTDTGKLLPFQSYYIYDTSRSPYYEITFAMQSVCALPLAIMYSGTDTFMGLLVFHVCGQLENLRGRILRISVDEFDNAMSYNVRDYGRLLRSVNIIDDAFTVMLLGLLIYFGILFALYGYVIAAIVTQGYSISPGRISYMIPAFMTTFGHMCLYCILGEILVIQCDGIYEAVCEYKWYKLEPRQARNLLPIMIRASKPLYLTAGKLFPMNMSTFCSLLKTSAGYMSVLLAYRS